MTPERRALDELLATYPHHDLWCVLRYGDPMRINVALANPTDGPMGPLLRFEIIDGAILALEPV